MRAAAGSRSDLPGLQAERTSLAWERTAVALFANGALLLLRHTTTDGLPALPAAGVALAAAVTVAVLGLRRARRIRSPDGTAVPARGSVVACAAAVVLVGVAVVVLESVRLAVAL